MRRCFASAALAALLGATCAWAQSWQFDVPFAFHVGEVQLPPGTYAVKFDQPYANVVALLSSTSVRDQACTLVIHDKVPGHGSANKLVFTRYGSKEYFLSQIWDSGHYRTTQLVKSKHELVTSKLIARLWPESIEIRATARPFSN